MEDMSSAHIPAFERVEAEDDARDDEDGERLEKEPHGDLTLQQLEQNGDEVAHDGYRGDEQHQVGEPPGQAGLGSALVLAELAEPYPHRREVERKSDEERRDGVVDRACHGPFACSVHRRERVGKSFGDDREVERPEGGRGNAEKDKREEIDHDVDRGGLSGERRAVAFAGEWNAERDQSVAIGGVRFFLRPAYREELVPYFLL